MRLSATDGDLSDPTEAYFGFRTSRTAASPSVFDESIYDILYPLPQNVTATGDDIKVAAIGAMSFNDNQAAPWFAPAGFNRGGLSAGAAGIPVTNVRSKLSSQERDELYDVNINPIASFPNEGIVIFGQKTLQVTPSALDRINVRRLMIFVKKEISRIAADLLFEPNVAQTWSRFTGRVNPLLNGIKNDFG